MPFINSVRGSFSALRRVGGAGGKNFDGVTGGTITTPGDGYRYHTFTTPGTFDATSVGAPFLVDYLVVAGGGGGGGEQSDQFNGGGGGGGGVLQASGASFSPSSFGVTVGEAGRYQTKPSTQIGENGGNSTLGPSITAIGGGGGGVDQGGGPGGGGPAGVRGDYGGQPGGSGGGHGNYGAAAQIGGDGTPSQGFPGGSLGGAGSSTFPAGGGGGAGGAGFAGDSGRQGEGGLTVIWPGNGVRYGGGGGGGATDAGGNPGATGKDPGGAQNQPQGGGGYGFTGADGFTATAYSARVGYLAPIGAGTQTIANGTITAATRLPWASMPGGSSLLAGLGMGGGGAGRIPATTTPGGGEGCPGSPGSVIVRYPLAQ